MSAAAQPALEPAFVHLLSRYNVLMIVDPEMRKKGSVAYETYRAHRRQSNKFVAGHEIKPWHLLSAIEQEEWVRYANKMPLAVAVLKPSVAVGPKQYKSWSPMPSPTKVFRRGQN